MKVKEEAIMEIYMNVKNYINATADTQQILADTKSASIVGMQYTTNLQAEKQ